MAIPAAPQSGVVFPSAGSNGGRKTYANQGSDGLWGRNYFSLRPKTNPLTLTISAGGVPALPTAAAAQIDQVRFGTHHGSIEMYQNTAQTLLPRLVAGNEVAGLEVGLDAVDNETVEYVIGGNNLANPYAYTVGTSAPAGFRLTLTLTDGSGTDALVMGWRKVEAYAAATAPLFLAAADPSYSDLAVIGIAAAAADGPTVRTLTDLNNSGVPVVSSTGFTWADTLTHTLEVRIYGRRVRYFINGLSVGSRIAVDGLGAAITAQETLTPPVFDFDTGDVLVPFFFNRYATTTPNTIFVSALGTLPGMEVGPLSEMGLDPSNLQR